MKLTTPTGAKFSSNRMRLMPVLLTITSVLCGGWILLTLGSNYSIQGNEGLTVLPNRTRACGTEDGVWGADTPLWTQQLFRQASLPPILGTRTPTKKFLSIGIASVYREDNYLERTLSSIVNETDPEEREMAVVVIYLADTEPENKDKQFLLIEQKFQPYLNSGFFQVIGSTPDIYPPMNFALTKRTFNDSADRVLWRTKQVIDFVYLFSYIKAQSHYHVVLEDDLLVASQFVTGIRTFIESKRRETWVALQVSSFLGIGLIYHSRDLPKLSQFLILFHQDQPVDMLMRLYINIESGNKEVTKREPSLVQHFGTHSTLPKKLQKITDSSFEQAKRLFRNRNPLAKYIVSTMKAYKDFGPAEAYSPTPGYFWGITARPQETYDIVFNAAQNISRIVVISGLPNASNKLPAKDPVRNGILEVSDSSSSSSASEDLCDNFKTIGTFHKGWVDVKIELWNIHCIRIKINTEDKKWVIIRELEIFS